MVAGARPSTCTCGVPEECAAAVNAPARSSSSAIDALHSPSLLRYTVQFGSLQPPQQCPHCQRSPVGQQGGHRRAVPQRLPAKGQLHLDLQGQRVKK